MLILYSISPPPVSLRTSQRSSAICPGAQGKEGPRKEKKKVVAVGLERNLECCVANVCSRSDTLARLSLTSVTAAPPQHLCVSSASSAPLFSPSSLNLPVAASTSLSFFRLFSLTALTPPSASRCLRLLHRARLLSASVSQLCFFLDGMIHYAFLYTPRIWHRLIFIYIYMYLYVCVCT